MPINPKLLIAAPMLQDSFVDKDGSPMAGGIITCYQDNSRTTLKNWYYQSSNFADAEGNYTFSRLPNPLTLSSAGTICDSNGVDTIPFFYPYSELDETVSQPYYITIVNHAQTNQITRPNFPYNVIANSVTSNALSVDNYIINNVFWRNIGSASLTSTTQLTVAPSQHDGFQYPDIVFRKNVTGAVDTVTFTKFAQSNTQTLTGDITPEFYLNHTCSGAGSGELQKCYQFPISLHLDTLNAVTYTVTIQAQNAGGTSTGENVIELLIFQDTGTGTTAPVPFPITSITLNPAWTKYEFTGVFPGTSGLTLGNGGDDAYYLQVQVPLNSTCNINFTKPSIYLTTDIPTNSFATYDEIDAIINSPRTGDIRTSLNSFQPYGWVHMNNGTIGSASSNGTARANQDTWQLFNLIWTLFSAYNHTTTNVLAQMVTSGGANVAYGASAIADFTANKAITLSQTMGRVLLGTVPSFDQQLTSFSTVITGSNSGGNLLITTSNNVVFYNGMPIYFIQNTGTLPSNLALNTVYYVSGFNGTNTFNVSTTYANAINSVVLAFTTTGTPTNSVVSSLPNMTTGEYSHTQLPGELATHTHTIANAPNSFFSNTGGAGLNAGATANTAVAITLNTAGSSVPFNIVQPAIYMNMFMKL